MPQRDKRVRIENAERVVYPLVGFTKREVVEFYTRVAHFMLPHLRGHPVTKVARDLAGSRHRVALGAPWLREPSRIQ